MKTLCAAVGLIMLFSTSTAAQDKCPTQADLRTGLRLINTADGIAQVNVARPDGLYQSAMIAVDARPDGAWWRLPHPILPGLRATEAGKLTIVYHADIGPLDHITKDETWTSTVTYLLDGAPHAKGHVAVHANGPSPFSPHQMGSCAYEYLTYRIEQHINTSWPLYDDVDFAPRLSLVIGNTPLDELGVPHGGFWFNALTVER